MRPRFGATAVGALCLVGAGCAPALYGSGPASIWQRDDHGAWVAVAGPTRGLRSNDGFAATIEGRESERSWGGELAPSPFVGADDELAPDPFAGPSRDDDALAPDPFARGRHEKRLCTQRPLAEDELAPDPFAKWRRETRPRNGKPLAMDELAPDPFAEPALKVGARASRRTESPANAKMAHPRVER